MVDLIELHFNMLVKVDECFADELGEDIAHNILCEMFAGDDVVDIQYVNYKRID